MDCDSAAGYRRVLLCQVASKHAGLGTTAQPDTLPVFCHFHLWLSTHIYVFRAAWRFEAQIFPAATHIKVCKEAGLHLARMYYAYASAKRAFLLGSSKSSLCTPAQHDSQTRTSESPSNGCTAAAASCGQRDHTGH